MDKHEHSKPSTERHISAQTSARHKGYRQRPAPNKTKQTESQKAIKSNNT